MRWQHPKWSGKLCIPTLQRLIIQDFHPSQFTRVTLDTPSLTYLECSDAMPDEYSIVNLDSLVEAKLHLMFTGGQYQYYIPYDGSVSHDHNNSSTNPTNLIKGLGNVEIMEILFQNTFVALYYFREAIPVFENLYHLTIRCDDEEDCMAFLPYLLEKSPKP
ncbi:F-box/LRR-repeat protein At3g58980 [Brassica napus]|uniref:F-box/LRR-repeat protein At3g58980 n=1 Tax=Brassica napus TaxID=3708 RepID=UPI000BBE690E|nr:F-box/LRR-repeat protein At3g58980 [Brassica napus]